MPLEAGACPLFSPQEAHARHAAASGTAEVRLLADTLARFRAVHVDPAEFACLKAIVLFRAGTEF